MQPTIVRRRYSRIHGSGCPRHDFSHLTPEPSHLHTGDEEHEHAQPSEMVVAGPPQDAEDDSRRRSYDTVDQLRSGIAMEAERWG